MISGAHVLVFSKQHAKMRKFFRDKLGLKSVDAGNGRLIFALPPSELGVHETRGRTSHELYLICDDVMATVKRLKKRGVKFSEDVADLGWGLLTRIRLPDGSTIGLYEPKHARPRVTAPRRRGGQ